MLHHLKYYAIICVCPLHSSLSHILHTRQSLPRFLPSCLLQILLYDKRCREQLTRHQQHASASSAMIVPQVPLSDAVASASSSMTPDADTDLSLGNNSVASVAAGLGATDCSDQEVYDLAIAHIAEGYTSCWPHHITVADELFTLVEALNHEVCLLFAVCCFGDSFYRKHRRACLWICLGGLLVILSHALRGNKH